MNGIEVYPYSISPSTVSTILNRLIALEDAPIKVTYFAVVSSTSGTITPPTGATILLDQFASSVDVLTSKIDGNGNPTDITPQTVGGTYVTSTLTAGGVYALSGTPEDASIALVYVYSVARKNFDITKSIGFEETNLFTNADRANLALAILGPLTNDVTTSASVATLSEQTRWQTVKTSVSSAEILALNGTPKQLLASPGVGKTYILSDILVTYTVVTTPYTTNVNLRVIFAGATVGVSTNNTILTTTATRTGSMIKSAIASTATLQYITNAALNLDVQTANPILGDGTIDVYVTYKILTV
jgi:hypothetical protein